MSDTLDEALNAFRTERDRQGGTPEATRARLLRSAHRRAARRKQLLIAGIIAALAATNSTTWAWSSGRLDPWLAREAPARSTPASADPQPVHGPSVIAREAAAEPVGPSFLDAPQPEPNEPTERRVNAPARASVEDPSPPARVVPSDDALARALAEIEPVVPEPPSDADRRAFAHAHRLHFDGAPRPRALQAWDNYLARFAHGRFVPEARFNRAIALLELGRDEEARAALRPFAEGAHGGMRRREAQRLIDALDRGALRR